jgi:hypothetical protein
MFSCIIALFSNNALKLLKMDIVHKVQDINYKVILSKINKIKLYTKRTNGVGLLSKAEKLGLLKDYPNLTNSNLYKRMYTVFTPEALALVRGKGRKMKEEEKEELE